MRLLNTDLHELNTDFHENINKHIYKTKPRFHRFYNHNSTIYRVRNSFFSIEQSLQAVWDKYKIILIFDFATLI